MKAFDAWVPITWTFMSLTTKTRTPHPRQPSEAKVASEEEGSRAARWSKQLRRSSKPQQLDDNLAAAELHLAIDELTALDVFTRPATVYPNSFTELVRDPAVEKALKG